MKITVTLRKPRNPLVASARFRRAGSHARPQRAPAPASPPGTAARTRTLAPQPMTTPRPRPRRRKHHVQPQSFFVDAVSVCISLVGRRALVGRTRPAPRERAVGPLGARGRHTPARSASPDGSAPRVPRRGGRSRRCDLPGWPALRLAARCAAPVRHALSSSPAACGGRAVETARPAPAGPVRRAAARPAARFSMRCASRTAFGMATTPACRITQASPSWAGVTPRACASCWSTRILHQPALVDGAVGHQGHAMALQPGQQLERRPALGE